MSGRALKDFISQEPAKMLKLGNNIIRQKEKNKQTTNVISDNM